MTLAYGDIYLVASGPYTSKPRPVIVVQNPHSPTGDSVLIVPLTSVDNPEIITRVAVAPTADNGLDRACFAEVDKLSAIKASALSRRIGALESPTLSQIIHIAVALISPETKAK